MNWLRAIKNVPLRLNEERSDQLSQLLEPNDNRLRSIYLSPRIGFLCPKHWLVIGIWRFHAFCPGGQRELMFIVELSQGCGKLLDLGSSAGIFSAIFTVSRKQSEI